MHILALDFDGVICDSSREVFVVSVDTYAAVEPQSVLLDQLIPLRDRAAAGGGEHLGTEIYGRFRDLLPLGNRAEDFGVSLRAIEDDAAIHDQEAYNAFYREIGQPWLDRYHRHFYECRGVLREGDVRNWLQLHLPFPGLSDMLRSHKDRTLPAVATAKDARSVRLLLDELGFDDVFDAELILDKETGVEKTHHLRVLHERTGAEFEDITFVDDKVNHLVRVAELGVRPVLAGWGFNTERERELAHQLGFEVADLESADGVLFKGE
jgi:phosphoglycolate phosphatase-like HAD superfamily hydrolase